MLLPLREMLAIAAARPLEPLLAAMTPFETVVSVCGLCAFLLGVLAFVGGIWKISWAVRGFMETQQAHAKNFERATEVLGEFVRLQKEMNSRVLESMQQHSEWLKRHDEDHLGLDRSMRGLYRELEEVQEGTIHGS